MCTSVETFAAEFIAAFWAGVSDYKTDRWSDSYRGVNAQAYDRGRECAMRMARAKYPGDVQPGRNSDREIYGEPSHRG